jgi:type I restriction enzyme R subunit
VTTAVEKCFDKAFMVKGLPLVIGEAKTPTRSAVTWFDGAFQINQGYEREVQAMFVPNVFSCGTEGRLFRYGSIRTHRWYALQTIVSAPVRVRPW